VPVRADGTTSFADLQAAADSRSTQNLVYFVFDLLFLNGKDLMAAPLLERKDQLQALLKNAPKSIQYSDHHIGDGKRFLEAVCGAKAEGIISKRVDAPYVPGNRGLWRKSKCLNREEFVIVGYSDPEGSRSQFGALGPAFPTRNTVASTTSSSRFAYRRCRSMCRRRARRGSGRRWCCRGCIGSSPSWFVRWRTSPGPRTGCCGR
jgi:ATP-dependent DNA ligase